MNSYLFYDIETTGLNPAFDQILQFAGIRTDMALREIDRLVLTIRLRPDVIPSPQAVLVHGLSPQATRSGRCEFEAIGQIHQWMNAPGTISIGYNTLKFDDEFLRFSFFRNLLPPYTHQYDKGCSRMDLYPMAIMFWLYRPHVLNWPEPDGKPSLTLANINAANALFEGNAHDALADTEATLAMARRLAAEQDMWNFLSGYFDKTTDLLRANKIPTLFESPAGAHGKALMISGKFGVSRHCQAPVLSIGPSVPYSNQSLWLRLDMPNLIETTVESIADTTWVVRKKMGEPGLLLPPLTRYWKRLDAECRGTVRENLQWIQSHPDLFQEIVRYHRDYRYPAVPDIDADAALYDMGFPSAEQQALCRRFHQADLDQKVRAMERFPKGVFRDLATRVLMRNYPAQLTGDLSAGFDAYMKRVNPAQADAAMVDFRGNRRRTPIQARSEIKHIDETGSLSENHRQDMGELSDYIDTNFPPTEGLKR